MDFLFCGAESKCWFKKSQLVEVSDEDPEVRKGVKVNISNV